MQCTRHLWIGLLTLLPLAQAQTPPANAPAGVRTLSLEQAIQLAVEHNFDLQIQRINPEIAQYSLSAAFAGYEPTLNLSGQHSYSSTPGSINNQGLNIPGGESERDSFNANLNGRLPTGLTYTLGASASDSYGDRLGVPFENATAQAGALTLTQPLLRNFWIDSTRANISVARNRLKYSEQQFRFLLMQTITAVEQSYYRLIFTRESVKVSQNALELSERLLAENKKRVEVGALAPLDEEQTESQVASSRAALISAQRALDEQENALKHLITDKFAEWHGIKIEPTQTLVAVPETPNLQESWKRGLALRPDLAQLRLDLERSDIDLRFDRNQLFPDLSLVGQYGLAGSGKEFSRALGQVEKRDNPFWYYGAQISIPLGNRAARNNYNISKAQKRQTELFLRQREQQILIEIDDAARLIRSSFERYEATRVARQFAERVLDAEQKKLENGKSTTFLVLQYQNDLTSARYQEIQALAEYNIALSQLAQREGTTLERHKINVSVK